MAARLKKISLALNRSFANRFVTSYTCLGDCPVLLYLYRESGDIKNCRPEPRETPKFAACTGDCADCNLRSQIARGTNDRMDALRDRSAWTYCPSWQERVTDTRRFRAILPRVHVLKTHVCARMHARTHARVRMHARMHAFIYKYALTHARMIRKSIKSV